MGCLGICLSLCIFICVLMQSSTYACTCRRARSHTRTLTFTSTCQHTHISSIVKIYLSLCIYLCFMSYQLAFLSIYVFISVYLCLAAFQCQGVPWREGKTCALRALSLPAGDESASGERAFDTPDAALLSFLVFLNQAPLALFYFP